MANRLTPYHDHRRPAWRRHASLGLAAAALWVLPAAASEHALTCGATTITLTCGEGDAIGNCRTAASSDATWNVTCVAKDEGGGEVRMDCRNATEVGGSPVEMKLKTGDVVHHLAEIVGDVTGSSCK